MDAIKPSEEINQDRRRFVETAAAGIAAAGALGLLPENTAAAGDDIRPFRINFPEGTPRQHHALLADKHRGVASISALEGFDARVERSDSRASKATSIGAPKGLHR
jgi:hypothetical protein